MKNIKKPIIYSILVIAGVSLCAVALMLLFDITNYGITIASFGASIFMILSTKKFQKRKLFGSYFIGIAVGFLFSLLPLTQTLSLAACAIFAILLMSVLNLQHAPAIGIGASIIMNQFSLWTDIIMLVCLFLILGMTLFMKNFIQNPDKALHFIEIEKEKIKWDF